MLGDISLATNIYIVIGYTDMRKSIDGLCAIVVNQLKEEPNGSSLYMFWGSGVTVSKSYSASRTVMSFSIKSWMLFMGGTAGPGINPR